MRHNELVNIQRGEIYWIDLNPTQGSETNKIRPCVIISATPINKARRTVVIIPLSSTGKVFPPLTIPVKVDGKEGVAVIDQIRAVDKTRLKKHIGILSEKEISNIEDSLRLILVLS